MKISPGENCGVAATVGEQLYHGFLADVHTSMQAKVGIAAYVSQNTL